MAIWSGRWATKKYQVKVKQMTLEIEGLEVITRKERLMAIEIKWDGPQKSGFVPWKSHHHHHHHHHQTSVSQEIRVLKLGGETIEFHGVDDVEIDNICSFSIISKYPTWFVSFHILCGDSDSSSSSSSSSRAKMQVIGKVGLNLGELASKMEAQIEHKIRVALHVDGVTMEATLRVLVGFVEMRNNNNHSRTKSHDSVGLTRNLGDSVSLLTRVKSQGGKENAKKNKTRLFGKSSSLRNSDESSGATNSESEYVVVVASSSKSGEFNSVSELGSSTSSEAQLDLVKKGGFWKWKRRRSFKKKAETSDSKPEEERVSNLGSGSWEAKELVSRDGKTKLKANVFLASYDQRSEKAAGESACAAIVTVIAHWLQSNHDSMPTQPEFDRLITEGSSEWRKLCDNESHKEFFPDQHFDLETILRARLRPLVVLPSDSRFGFFHPEKFDHLKDAVSFDNIWDEINTKFDEYESRVYIVRWNDHFFVLKVQADANYIVDSLGERLHEGCDRAYILKFDDSNVMYGKEEGEEKVICRGKECCREYMKRFLAAIPLRELKEEEEKGKVVDVFALYQRLQIDFHLSNPSSAVSTANTSFAASPTTPPLFLGDEEYVEE